MKLLTVAIPCYNSESYMEHCINTLLTGGEEVEIIIVDDGSAKDRTGEIGMPGNIPLSAVPSTRKTAGMGKR